MAEERRIQLAVEVDATQTRTGFDDVRREAGTMATSVERSGERAGRAIDGIGEAATGASRQMGTAERSLVGSIQRATAALEAGSRSGSRYYEVLATQRGVDRNVLEPYLAQLRAVEAAQVRSTAAVAASRPALDSVGVSAAQTAAALRGVPAQFTDIVTSLQGGQQPLTVFLQQGGQLRDTFGSAGGAARGLAGYVAGLINPFTLAAAAAGVLAVAYNQGSKEVDAYERAIVMTGNAVGTTSSQIADMARNISGIVGTQGKAATTLTAMAQSGQVAGDNLERFSRVAIELERNVGRSVEATVSDLAALGKAPLEASKKLSEQYHYLTAATYDQIHALTEQGRTEEAAAAAQQAYIDAFEERSKKLETHLGTAERSWRAVKDAAASAWDTILGVGREDTVGQKLGRASNVLMNKQAGLAEREAQGKGSDRISQQLRADIAQAQAYKAQLEGQADAANRLVAIDTGRQALDKADIEWKEQGLKLLTKQQQIEKEIADARKSGLDAGRSDQEIEQRIAAIKKRYAAPVSNDGVDAQVEAIKRRAVVEEKVAQRSRDLLESNRALGLVAEEQYIQAVEQLDVAAFEREKSRLQEELRLVAAKPNSLKDQAALRGQIAAVEEDVVTRRLQTEGQLNQLEVKRNRDAANSYANLVERAMAERDAVAAQVATQLDYNATIGRTADEVAALTAQRQAERAAMVEQAAAYAATPDLAAIYRQRAAAMRELTAAQLAGAESQRAAKAAQELDSFLDPSRAKNFGDALRDAFGGAGSAIVAMTGALTALSQKQAETDKQRGNAALLLLTGKKTEKQYAEDLATIDKKATGDRLRGYGDMAGAAAGFFGEQSRGYKALTTASQVFHAAELAATLTELVPKGISAVLNQGNGDPYTAFGRMAAMAAIVAGLGVAIGGIGGSSGGGGMSAADMQKQQGTGSVFGDANAQSDSIAASLGVLEDNSDSLIPINKGMLDALRAIEASMAGLTNLVVRVPGLVDGKNLGIATGTVATSGSMVDQTIGGTAGSLAGLALGGPLGAVVGGLLGDVASKLWGKTKKEIVDSGLQFGGSVRDLQGGTGFQQYASVDTTKSSYFGLKKKTTNSVEVAGLDPELSTQFGLVFKNVEAALDAAAIGLGVGSDRVTQVLNSLSIDETKISLKGLSGQALTDAISAVISKATDDMASAVFPELDSFRQVGEGYAQTVIRLASDYGQLDVALQSIGKQFGAVGLQSLAAREHLIELAGGIDNLVEETASFADNFLTEAERLAPVQRYVAEQLAAMGLSAVTTKDQFKALVQGLDVSTEAGAKQYAALMGLADAFAAVADGAMEAAKARGDLEGQIFDLTHTAAEATARARQVELAALDASLRPLQERIYVLQDEKSAAEAAAEAVKKAKDAAAETRRAQQQALEPFTQAITGTMAAAKSAAKALQEYQASLLVGDMSPMSKQQQVAAARDQFDAAEGSGLQAASNTYLTVLKSFGVNSLEYAKGFAAVQTRLSSEAGRLSDYGNGLPQLLLALQRMSRGVDGSHATGLDSVPFDGYRAELHRGEKVLTSAEASDYRGGAAAIERNSELLKRLIDAVETGNKSGQAVADTLRRVTRDGNALKTEPA